jgi:hypothetical protein
MREEPYCIHDLVAVVNGVCECGTRVTYLGTGIADLDAAKRYLRAKFRTSPPEPVPVLSWPCSLEATARHLVERHGTIWPEDDEGSQAINCAGPPLAAFRELYWRHDQFHVDLAGDLRMLPADGHVHVRSGQRFYVSVKSGRARGLLLGPYASYMVAESHVEEARRRVYLEWDQAWHFGYGVASSAATLPTRFGR